MSAVPADRIAALRGGLGARSIVLVGMMGSGKSSVGRRLAQTLGLPFVDADHEIETAAGRTIAEIFAEFGEDHFRDGERRVIARLLGEGPQVLATGGGAVMNAETRAAIATHGISVWLHADLPVLMKRVRRRSNRPLLQTDDPEAVMQGLLDARNPLYAQADIKVESRNVPHMVVVHEIIDAVADRLATPIGTASTHKGPSLNTQSDATDMQTTGTTRTVRVDLGPRSYDVVIGPNLLKTAGQRIADVASGARAAIVADANVHALHGETLAQSLDAAGISHVTITMPPGEASKCFAELERVTLGLIDAHVERGDIVIALGGGVAGDLAGFAAAITRRGVRFVQVPTSLLAQVDSSIGGKTGIDVSQGKNLVGAFHQPALVLADTDLLHTLPARQFRAGYAEIAKFGLLGDATFFGWLEANAGAVFAGDENARMTAIETACAGKADIVARDELEGGVRALLNLGHTFGHALESATGYGERLLHGEAISIGMALAFEFSVAHGHCPRGDADRAIAHLAGVGLPTTLAQVEGPLPDADGLVDLMRQDKKMERGSMTLILARAIGEAYVARNVEIDRLRAFLKRHQT